MSGGLRAKAEEYGITWLNEELFGSPLPDPFVSAHTELCAGQHNLAR
jgi:hypothetical protein